MGLGPMLVRGCSTSLYT